MEESRLVLEIDKSAIELIYQVASVLQYTDDLEHMAVQSLAGMVLEAVLDLWCVVDGDAMDELLRYVDESTDSHARLAKIKLRDLTRADADKFPLFANSKDCVIEHFRELDPTNEGMYFFNMTCLYKGRTTFSTSVVPI